MAAAGVETVVPLPFVNVVPRDRIVDGLRLMKRNRDTLIDAAVGREISIRDGGIRAVLAGRVERIGSAYTISLQIVKPADGSIAGTVGEDATDRNDLLPAARRAALRLRERLGEALPAIEASRTALAKVTTPSLHALQLYSKAASVMSTDVGPDETGAPQLLRAALVEDPQFVAARILLGHAISPRGFTFSEALHHAELAWRAGDGVSEVERLFASANYYRLRGFAAGPTGGRPDLERAAAEYEALLRIQPDHYWGLTDAAQIYQLLHNYSQARVMYAQIADARPVSFYAQARAAVEAFRAGDLDQAHAFAARAQALPAELQTADAFWAVWLDLMPAHEAWLRGDAAAALAEVDAVAARGPRAPTPFMRFQFGRQIIALYVTLGALTRAEAAVSSLPTIGDQNHMLAVAASQRADLAALRALLTSRFTTVSDMANVPSLFLQARLFDHVRRILDRWKTDPTTRAPGSVESLEGRLAVVQGRPDAAIPLLERSRELQWDVTGGPGPLQIARTIASAWAARGDAAQAIQVLEAVSAESRTLQAIGHSAGYEWIRNQAQLADLYRKTNRLADARTVENELRQLLAVADGDHAIKLALEGRNE